MRRSTLWKSSVLSLLLLGFALSITYAQQRTVTGTVTSEDQGALPGVNIVVQGTTQGAVTDAQGNYTISVPGDDATLVFSFIGYSTQAVTVGAQTTINVTLAPDITSLDEIVVTAYATQKKGDLTGSVGVVNTEQLNQMPQSNITQQIQGRVAGVSVTQDARPGQSAKVRIRGLGSFQNNEPLYVVDGVPTTDIATLNPGDVESMSVLKDAGAASIYGARAANGVIVITTKKGSAGKMNVNFNAYGGISTVGKGPTADLCNTQEMADLVWLISANDGTVEDHPLYGLTTNPEPTLPFWADDTDWFSEATQRGSIQNYDLSLSGGTQGANYFASLGYLDQTGETIYSWYKRFSARFNSEFTVKDRLTLGENINIVHRSDRGVANQGEQTAVTGAAYRSMSIIPVIWDDGPFQGDTHFWEDGDWGGTGIAARLGNGSNYVASQTRNKDDKWQDLRILGNVYADLKVIEGLNLRTSIGGSINNSYQTDWNGSTYENAENSATPTYREQAWIGGFWTWTNTLTFSRQLGDHNILAVAGYEANRLGLGRNVFAQGSGFFTEDNFAYRTVSTADQLQSGGSGFNTPRSLVSQFLRADYNFRSKYYLSGTIRRDGSSVFGPDTRYGIFPSVSAGWRISEESFLSGLDFINDFKIRGGYGTMGNQAAVSTGNQFYLYSGAPDRSFYDINGTYTSSVPGFRPSRIGNADAKWETNITANAGFDGVLFDRKLELSFDWYMKKNVDLLYNPELPGTAGNASRPYVNVGEMLNSGVDVSANYRQVSGDFSFEAMVTFTTVHNEIVKIAEGIEFFDATQDGGARIGSTSRNEVGYPVGSFFGYNFLGFFMDQGDVDSHATQPGAEPGFLKYDDTDGDGEITPDDRIHIGNPNPDFTYSLNLNLGYKGFDLIAFFYGSQGNDIVNQNKWWLDFWSSFIGQKSVGMLNDSWTPTNTGAAYPKASTKANFSTSQEYSNYYIEDGSYFRLKNLQIGYTFDRAVIGNLFSNLRIYIQGTNLFTLTKYSGLDPELYQPSETVFGVDQGNLPASKQFIVGVNLGF